MLILLAKETQADPEAHLPPELLISASDASHLVERPTTPVDPEKEITDSTNAAGWDDFPNGRFGDSSSPAFGALDSWATSGLGVTVSPCRLSGFAATSYLTGSQAAQGVARWGEPTSLSDIQAIFLAYLDGISTSTPFSPEPLDRESASIVSYLRKLVQKGWWTVASQPAVDALPSSDPIVGWGPRGGYVFQKAFVECFCEKSSVEWLENKVKKMVGRCVVSYYAANSKVRV